METVNDKHRLTAVGTVTVLAASLAALALGTALVGQAAAATGTETPRTVTKEESMAGTMKFATEAATGNAETNELLPNDGAQSDAADADMGNGDLAHDDGAHSEEPFLDEDMSSNAFDEAAPYDDLVEQGSRPVDDGLSTTLPTTSADNPGNSANGVSDQ